MGCQSSTKQTDNRPVQKTNTTYEKNRSSSKQIKKKQDWNFSSGKFVSEVTTTIEKNYKMNMDAIGEGGYGTCYKAMNRQSNEVRAIKIIKKDFDNEEETQQLLNEVNILQDLDHPNIVNIHEFFHDQDNFYVIMDLCEGGELFDRIVEKQQKSGYSEKETAAVIRSVLQALNYCHKKNIVHRDLKPENIMLVNKTSDSNIKVIDWGTARIFDNSKRMARLVGTPYYIAPEVLNHKYDEKCDVWSVGVICYIIIAGYPPFNGSNEKEILNNIKKGEYNFNHRVWNGVSQSCKRFIMQLLTFDPLERPSAEQALELPWLKNDNIVEYNQAFSQDALTNLQNFNITSKLQKATWVYLVQMLGREQEKENLDIAFKQLDANNDGKLTKQEIVDGWHKAFKTPLSEELVKQLFSKIDTNDSGEIDFSEFIMACINRKKLLTKKRLEKLFKLIDKDNSGTIDAKELKETFDQQSNSNVAKEMWAQLIKEADIDDGGDGVIDRKEFIKFMMKMDA